MTGDNALLLLKSLLCTQYGVHPNRIPRVPPEGYESFLTSPQDALLSLINWSVDEETNGLPSNSWGGWNNIWFDIKCKQIQWEDIKPISHINRIVGGI